MDALEKAIIELQAVMADVTSTPARAKDTRRAVQWGGFIIDEPPPIEKRKDTRQTTRFGQFEILDE